MYDNLQNQSIVRFERIVSGRFSPLTAPLLLRSQLRSHFPAQLFIIPANDKTNVHMQFW